MALMKRLKSLFGAGGDPVLQAKTVGAFIRALNKKFGWKLPTEFPSGSMLADLWAVAVTVTADPEKGVLYVAEADTPSAEFGLADNVKGRVRIKVTGDGVEVERPDGRPTLTLV